MRRLVVTEHTRIERGPGFGLNGHDCARLDSHDYDRLRAFDRANRDDRDRVFEWSDGYARSTQWVGVVQVPGIQIEILPKIDALAGDVVKPETEIVQARRNLLYMLSVSGDVPVRSRAVARLATRQAPMSETLSAIFADRLRQELLRGPERAYQVHEANSRVLKGKLLMGRQTVHNAANRERFFCGYDELSDDTVMNRIFRVSCRMMLESTRMSATQEVLRQCLLLLDGVTDCTIQESDFAQVAINRQNERFEDILRFCRMLHSRRTPTIQAGSTPTFSLLFDMNKVFERFVVALLRRYVARRLVDLQVFPHATQHKRHLLQSDGAGALRLEPDVLVMGPANRLLVMDTKWKLLAPGRRGRGGVSEADLYQLFAYTRRYGCKRSVLLYPHVPGLETRDFDILNENHECSGDAIAIRHVNLHRNLYSEAGREALISELEGIVREGLELATGPAAPGYGDAA